MTQRGLRWWRELLYVAAFYGVYSVVRSTGAATESARAAYRNALSVIRLERALGLYHEEAWTENGGHQEVARVEAMAK